MSEHNYQALYTVEQFAGLTASPAGVIVNLIDEGKIRVVYIGGCQRIPHTELVRAIKEGI